MKAVIMILMFCPFFAAHPSSSPDKDLIAKEKARLQGTWVIRQIAQTPGFASHERRVVDHQKVPLFRQW
jgi:hypothetical protein